MLQFKNGTPFPGTIYLLPDADGIDSLFTVVKATLTVGERVARAGEQAPIILADEHHGEPGESSVRRPADISLTKPGTDVLLLGTAHGPGGRPTTDMDVSLAIGPLRKTVRVFGDRLWKKSATGYAMTRPEPFRAVPLVWERAYGGRDQRGGQPGAEARNPVGTGYRDPDGDTPPDGLRLPNLEDPEHAIGSWKHAPPPAAFAPISAHWEPRRSYAGTYDERWQRERAPYLPEDFDARFLQLAPPDLVAPAYLRGGEWVEVRGATPSGMLRFQLPPVGVGVTYLLDGIPQPTPAHLDTVLIEPDDGRLTLVWRAVLRCDKKARRVNEVQAALLHAA